MAGKTGTAQVRSYGSGGRAQQRRRDLAAERPRLVRRLRAATTSRATPCRVLVEHGGLGGATAAAPRAREIMRVALLKDPELRARIEKPLPMPQGPQAVDAPDAAPDPLTA